MSRRLAHFLLAKFRAATRIDRTRPKRYSNNDTIIVSSSEVVSYDPKANAEETSRHFIIGSEASFDPAFTSDRAPVKPRTTCLRTQPPHNITISILQPVLQPLLPRSARSVPGPRQTPLKTPRILSFLLLTGGTDNGSIYQSLTTTENRTIFTMAEDAS